MLNCYANAGSKGYEYFIDKSKFSIGGKGAMLGIG